MPIINIRLIMTTVVETRICPDAPNYTVDTHGIVYDHTKHTYKMDLSMVKPSGKPGCTQARFDFRMWSTCDPTVGNADMLISVPKRSAETRSGLNGLVTDIHIAMVLIYHSCNTTT
jgi:hypothetical protein